MVANKTLRIAFTLQKKIQIIHLEEIHIHTMHLSAHKDWKPDGVFYPISIFGVKSGIPDT